MKRIRIPRLVDVLISDDPAEIEALAQEPELDREYANSSLAVNRYVLRHLRRTLQVDGRLFPTITGREDQGRVAAQETLWARLNALATSLSEGPNELEGIAAFVRGEGAADACGPLVQQVVGCLFVPDFKATPESWAAAVILDKAVRTMNPALLAWWSATKRVDRAKCLLSEMVRGDLAGVHAVGIALHNIVSGVCLMRNMFSDPEQRAALSPETASAKCLFAPSMVLRQPTRECSFAKDRLMPSTLVLLKLQTANKKSPDPNTVFLQDTWSRCPAEQWVPALLEGVWRRTGH
jgi:hypothetical protein